MPSLLNQIVGGNFTDLEGFPLSSGYLTLELSHDGVFAAGTPETQVVAGLKRRVYLDNNGNIAGSVSVVANDQLLPASTYYNVMAYKSDGTKAWASEQFWQILSSPSPFNVGTIEPTNPPASGLNPVSPAVLLNPSGNQIISAFNLDPAASNTTQSLGQSGSPWNVYALNETITGTLTDGAASVGTAGQVLESTGTGVAWTSLSTTLGFNNITSGTNTTATMTVGTGATLTTSGTGVINASKIDSVAVTGVPTSGQVPTATSGTAATWQTPAVAFNNVASGSNTTATMTVGTGGSLATTGSGVINANEISGITVSGTPSTGQALVATSSSAADWQSIPTVAGGGFTKIQAGSSSVNSGATITFPATFTTLVALTIGNYGGSANITSSSTSGFVVSTSSNPQRIDWIAVGT